MLLPVPTSRLTRAVGVLLTIAALTLAGAAPVGAEPVREPACPETRAQLAGQTITSLEGLPDLTCADLHDAVLDGVDLSQEDLSRVDAHGASFRNADLVQADLTGANLRGARFDGAKLGQATLTGANLRDAHFGGADLGQAHMDLVDARNAVFTEADLGQADLKKADLRGADFTSASLIQAHLEDSDLRGARTLFAAAIQADAAGAEVDLLDPRTLQMSLLVVLVGAVLLVKSIVNAMRGLTPGDRAVQRGVTRLIAFAVVNGMLWLVVGLQLLPLMYISVLYPMLVGALLVFLSGAVRGYRPARFGPAGAGPSPVDFSISR
jgi:uncharacterized protein YjbI with pentapeptide repeats